MATVNKDFRVKNGLVVEGATGTIDGENIITEGSTTDQLSEGSTNKYFTDARVVTALGTTDTDSLPEGASNLYFTDQRAQDAVTNNLTTDDIDEGVTNEYYTDARARAALSGGTGITYTSGTGEIAADTSVLATKTYVDEVAEGLIVRGSVEAATNADLGATYSNGTNGVDATLTIPATATLTIDGWSDFSVGDGILVKDQTDATENGRYFVDVVGDAVTDWVLKRCTQCDEPEEVPGSYVFVQHGTTYEATGWVATVANAGTFAIGTDDIDWVQFSGAGTYTAGTGLALNGTEFSLDATTSNVSEGTNLYFTDERAQDAVATAISNGTHTNITITYDDNANSISFEGASGFDSNTTDDLDEGSTNLYFTDQRAIDALDGTAPSFQEVEINSLTKTFAVTSTVATADVSTQAYTFAHATYRSAKMTVKFAYGTHTEVSEILLTMDTSDNIAITEYAMVQTNGSMGSVTATLDGTNVDINVTVPNASTDVTIFGTLIA
jgi:hypothetical protein